MEEFAEVPVQAHIQYNYYDGSRKFLWLANMCGLSVDLVNFLICQISALFLASLFRSLMHPSKVSTSIRQAFGLSVGLMFGYFCFGQQAIHIAGLPTICYIVIRTQNPAIVQRIILIVAMVYLLMIHLHRQIYDYDSSSLDVTAPLMIITQKVTSLAFSIHDGFIKDQKNMTNSQKYHAVNKIPSALEFFSYVLHFQGVLAGPLVFYRDYMEFIEGYNFIKNKASKVSPEANESNKIVYEPSPTKTVVKKVIGSCICGFIFMKFATMYPIKSVTDEDFLNSTTLGYKFWYIMMATTAVRFKYYHAWMLADAICNNSGLGFTGYDKDGNPNWDLISNIHVMSFELATNMRDAINSWNVGTNIWLRSIVYERVPKSYGTLLTFALSAIWHGFYPGYYLTFATGALFVTAARSARRLLRYRFQSTQYSRIFYDILTFVVTRVAMGYATFPFVLLEFEGSIRMYLKLFMCLHIISFVVTFILPKYIAGVRETKLKSSNENIADISSDNNKSNKNRIMDQNNRSSNRPNGSITREPLSTFKHDECEINTLSNKLREKIEIETRNIEEFIDKTVNETVTGIVGFKNDLMRLDEGENYNPRRQTKGNKSETMDAFIKKEINALNAAVQQTNVIPVVIGNVNTK